MITTGQLNGRGQNSSKNFNHMYYGLQKFVYWQTGWERELTFFETLINAKHCAVYFM